MTTKNKNSRRHWILFAAVGIIIVTMVVLFSGGSLRGSVLDDRVLSLTDRNQNGTLSVGEMRRGISAVFQGMFSNNLAYDLNQSSGTDRFDLKLFLQSIRGFLTAVCGNGVIQAGEKCDDGNTAPGDGCSSACRIEPMDYGDLNQRENWGMLVAEDDHGDDDPDIGHCVYERDLGNGKKMITDVHYPDPAHPC